ncbi:MAG TPA: hypothetical protein VFL14_15275 [Xanthomonadales bacterium]|nr:hypothetical protein [Xanthomonadales bacterium]
MSVFVRAAALVSLAVGVPTAHAATFCVGTLDELSAAIVAGQLNHQPDDYRLRAGTYLLAAPIRIYAFDAQGASFSGGWDPACTSQALVPGATVVDGQGASALFDIREPGAPPVNFVLDHLTLRGGSTADEHVVSIQGQNATVRVAHCVFAANVAGGATRALLAIRTGKPVDVLDNAFVGNSFAGRAIDVDLVAASQPDGALRRVLGNTIAFNTSTGGTAIRSGRAATIANNLTWGNGTTLDVDTLPDSNVLGNSLQHGALPGNTTGDPHLQAGSWKLLGTSPLRDAGVGVAVTGTASTRDLDGDARVRGAAIDIGADELGPAQFADGFE